MEQKQDNLTDEEWLTNQEMHSKKVFSLDKIEK